MKRFIFLIIFSFSLLLGSIISNAEELTKSSEKLTNAGTIPGDFFYKFDRFFENLSLSLTFDDEKKVEKHMRYAEERLAEINQLDPEEDLEWLDKLFDDYGVSLYKTNILLTNIIIKGEINSDKLEEIQIKLENITTKEEKINLNAKEKINEESKTKVQEVKVDSYLISISEKVSKEEQTTTNGKSIGEGMLIKLKSLSNTFGLSIDDILEMDIYVEDDLTTKEVEKEIDFLKLESELGLDKEQLIDNLKDFQKSILENRKAEKEKEKIDNQKGKTDEEKEELKKEIEERQKESQEKLNELQEKIRESFLNGNEQNEDNERED